MRSIEQLRERVRKCRERGNKSSAFKAYWRICTEEAETELIDAINIAREDAAAPDVYHVLATEALHRAKVQTHVVVGDHQPEPRTVAVVHNPSLGVVGHVRNLSLGVVGHAQTYPTRAQGGYGASFDD